MKRNRNRRRGGFTLMEVLLVLVILVMLGGLVGISIRQVQKSADRREAKVQIGLFEEAIELFQMEHRRYPSTDEGLEALIAPPNGDDSYLKGSTVPLDPWESPYQYELLDPDHFRISSSGPDGDADTDDDIASDIEER